MKFQNEIKKYAFQRFMQRLGLRVDSAKHGAFSYDARNYPKLDHDDRLVIFDVGANIGQSSIWYARSFPKAVIFAFEPFRVIYQELVRRVRDNDHIRCENIALLDRVGEIYVPSITDAFCQSGKVVSSADGASASCERISVQTVDSFAKEREIEHIHILKTDTEGFDSEVVSGASGMLEKRKISCILTEATLFGDDSNHTSLSRLQAILEGYSFYLHGLYDLHYSAYDGRLEYCNALFRLSG
jgi:FkbM family methyltransferase